MLSLAERRARRALLSDEELAVRRARRLAALAEASGAAPLPAAPDPLAERLAPVPPPVRPARLRRRHVWAVAAFLLMVLAPVGAAFVYMQTRAADRFASHTGFSVRIEESASPFDLIAGAGALGSSGNQDSEILAAFLQSPDLVARIDARLGLRALWAKGDPARDPLFAYHAPGTIEDLTDYWRRMVHVYQDGGGSGLIDLEVQAFTAEDAQAIALAIAEEGRALMRRLTEAAHDDATRSAREELDAAVERLKLAREAMTGFRNEHQIVDPAMALQGQMVVIESLQQQLAQALIDLDILRQNTTPGNPRIAEAEQRAAVIEARIAEERAKLGSGNGAAGGQPFAEVVGGYERLAVDLEFAAQSYTAALAALDLAQGEARRQSRYLTAHVGPTLPEAAIYPERGSVVALVALFAFLAWAVTVLVAYALRDRA